MSSEKQGNTLKEKLGMNLFPKIQLKDMKSRLKGRNSSGEKGIPRIAIIPPTPGSPKEATTSFFSYALHDALPKSLDISKSPFRRNSEPWRISGKGNNSRKRRPRNERSMSLPEGEERTKDLLQVPSTPRRKKKTRRGSLSDDQINLKWITDNARIDRQVMSFAKPREVPSKPVRMGHIREESTFERSLSLPTSSCESFEYLTTEINTDESMLDANCNEMMITCNEDSDPRLRKNSVFIYPLRQEGHEINGVSKVNHNEMIIEDAMTVDNDAAGDDKSDTDGYHENAQRMEYVLRKPDEMVNNMARTKMSFETDGRSKAINTVYSFRGDNVSKDPTNQSVRSNPCEGKVRVKKSRSISDGELLNKAPYFSSLQQGRNFFHRLTDDLVETISPKLDAISTKSCKNCKQENTSVQRGTMITGVNDQLFSGSSDDSATAPRRIPKGETNVNTNTAKNESKKPMGIFCLDNLLEALNRTT